MIPPYLIGCIDESSCNFVKILVDNSLLFLNQIPVEDFSGSEKKGEPDDVDEVDNYDGIEISKEVDICSKEIEPYRSVLDYIAHPLLFDCVAVRSHEKVEVFNDVQTSNRIAEGLREIVGSDVDVKENELESQDVVFDNHTASDHDGDDDRNNSDPSGNAEEDGEDGTALNLILGNDVKSLYIDTADQGRSY